jgi:hypothetical protein
MRGQVGVLRSVRGSADGFDEVVPAGAPSHVCVREILRVTRQRRVARIAPAMQHPRIRKFTCDEIQMAKIQWVLVEVT